MINKDNRIEVGTWLKFEADIIRIISLSIRIKGWIWIIIFYIYI